MLGLMGVLIIVLVVFESGREEVFCMLNNHWAKVLVYPFF